MTKKKYVLKNVWVEDKDAIHRLKESKFSLSKISQKTTNDFISLQSI